MRLPWVHALGLLLSAPVSSLHLGDVGSRKLDAVFVIPIGGDRLDLLPYVKANIIAAGKYLKDYSVVIATPSSEQQVLEHWDTSRFPAQPDIVRGETTVFCRTSDKICHIGAARNAAIQYVEYAHREKDVVIFVDSDICRQWDPKIFKRALSFSGEWSGLTANGIGPAGKGEGFLYIDMLAFHPGPNTPRQISPDVRHAFDPHLPPFEVDSAFGGLGIYRMSDVRGCRYSMSDKCEHWEFHRCIRSRGGKVFVHPALVVEWKDFDEWNKTRDIAGQCARTWEGEPPDYYDFEDGVKALHMKEGPFPTKFIYWYPPRS